MLAYIVSHFSVDLPGGQLECESEHLHNYLFTQFSFGDH